MLGQKVASRGVNTASEKCRQEKVEHHLRAVEVDHEAIKRNLQGPVAENPPIFGYEFRLHHHRAEGIGEDLEEHEDSLPERVVDV